LVSDLFQKGKALKGKREIVSNQTAEGRARGQGLDLFSEIPSRLKSDSLFENRQEKKGNSEL
jgi:hypothetical protein